MNKIFLSEKQKETLALIIKSQRKTVTFFGNNSTSFISRTNQKIDNKILNSLIFIGVLIYKGGIRYDDSIEVYKLNKAMLVNTY